MDLQYHLSYAQALYKTIAKLDADPFRTAQSMGLRRILSDRLDLLEHPPAGRVDSHTSQFRSDQYRFD